ncbi:MAG: hypothetical protein HC892_00365 [Saprospiraceae bacterium]|nr:hypothetical protein [Saprospiraceae bacterium]
MELPSSFGLPIKWTKKNEESRSSILDECIAQYIRLDDLVGIDGATGNHGCSDYAIGRIWAIDRDSRMVSIEIVECNSCTSCWQCGHDADHIFAEVGDTWKLSFDELRVTISSSLWSSDIRWEC